ncbi:FimV/HubP family polar landmark protein [Stutzerimonas marianensis]|uniref:FimV/HubP family polar landmark protein n=1 Tax=Stutzerimonas marianensis TaxID=2929513 RepID=UPI003C2FB1E5
MVRVRNLVLAIAAATALTSEMAYALGLGEVTLKSALNQPLVAEIELLDAKSLAPGEVVPVLASVEDFNKAGVDRQYFLTDLTFTPVLRPDGKSIIRVSSTKPVREPYLNFLIEVLWPNGRLLREYTLLLDPPLYSPEIAAAVAPQLPVSVPTSRPAAPSRTPTPSAAGTPAASTVRPLQGNEYKVTPNDTLWEIAERARQGGTVHQAMLAIQDLNPDAFIGGNINRMKNGQVLRLPTEEQVRSRSQAEAIQQVAQQNASWRQGAGVAGQGSRQLDATQRGQAGAAPARSETGDNLRLVAPEAGEATTGSDTGGTDDTKSLRDKLAVTEESLDSSRRENLDLKDRLNDLQGQLDKLQRLMELKDNQLAKLQAQLGADAAPISGAPADVDAPVDTQADADNGAAEPVTAGADAQGSESPVEQDDTAQPVEPVQQPTAQTSPAPVAAAPEPAPVSAPSSEASESGGFVDDLMGNPVMLGVIGGSALLLLLVGLMALSRRNAMKEAELQESLLAENEDDHFYGAVHEGAASGKDNYVNQAPVETSPADALAGAATDPLAEADIYIAYGRFNQAAELLQNALNDEPQRSDLRLKLMEVYAELGDREGFARQESELRDIGGSTPAIEQLKARYPGMAVAAAAGFATGAAASSQDDLDTLSLDDLDLDGPAAPVAKAESDSAFDLSLDDLELDEPMAPTAPVEHSKGVSETDAFSFDELSLEAAAEEQRADDFALDLDESTAADVSFEQEMAAFSLDLDEEQAQPADNRDDELGLNMSAAADAPVTEPAADSFDFELPELTETAAMPEEFDLSLEEDTSAQPENFASRLEEVEAELQDLSRDLEEPAAPLAAAPAAESADELGDDFDFFSDTDETTTKLDLARAYIDMGDAEGARDILDEVMNEGSDVQQQEAREMLAKLA